MRRIGKHRIPNQSMSDNGHRFTLPPSSEILHISVTWSNSPKRSSRKKMHRREVWSVPCPTQCKKHKTHRWSATLSSTKTDVKKASIMSPNPWTNQTKAKSLSQFTASQKQKVTEAVAWSKIKISTIAATKLDFAHRDQPRFAVLNYNCERKATLNAIVSSDIGERERFSQEQKTKPTSSRGHTRDHTTSITL